MILSDKSIKEKVAAGIITITPFDVANVQPASYDLHLGTKGLVFNRRKHHVIDVKQPVTDLMVPVEIEESGFVLHPGEFLLANVEEVTGVDAKHVGRLEGKSSLGRLGLIIHATAGFLDPGNCLKMTLEIANLSELPIKIYPGMKIAQIAFEEIDQPCEKPYGTQGLNSKYKGDMTVKESKMYQNFPEVK